MTPPTQGTSIFNTANIPVFLNAELLRMGIPAFIGWDATSSALHHWLIGGNSGAGKSTHMALCLAKASKYLPTARLYLLDFKGSDDFRYLRDIPNARYFFHEKCAYGLRRCSEEIESRLNNNPDRSPIFVVFDEYSSFYSYIKVTNKTLASQSEMHLMNLLFLSRGVGGYCWVCTQRPRPGHNALWRRERSARGAGMVGTLFLAGRGPNDVWRYGDTTKFCGRRWKWNRLHGRQGFI